jgi:hypothetical protein
MWFPSFTTLQESWYQSWQSWKFSRSSQKCTVIVCEVCNDGKLLRRCTQIELVGMHFMYGLVDCNAVVGSHLYQERYPGWRCPDKKTFVSIHCSLCEHGSFVSCVVNVVWPKYCGCFEWNSCNQHVKGTVQVGVTRSAVWRVLWEQQLYTYHLQHIQVLSSQYYHAQVMFCQWFSQQCDTNHNFPACVIFRDEAQFTRDGIQNVHTQCLWADENPHGIL